MTTVYRDIFRAIHEGKWLAIEYRNQSDQITKYWIGIKNLDIRRKRLSGEGLHTGECKMCPLSRAFGIKPYSTVTEEAFLKNLNHALENIWMSQSKYTVEKEVAISHVFQNNTSYNDLFYTGRFDFVVYKREGSFSKVPILAIELDGKEHYENDIVMQRDKKKNAICMEHDLQLIRVENSYARRYNYIKEILIDYFGRRH